MAAEKLIQFHHPMSTEEIVAKQRQVTDFIRNLLDKTEALDPTFKFSEIILSGSVAEGLKVREPNEFDFILVLEREFELLENVDDPPGFVSIKYEQGQCLHPLRLRKKFYRVLSKVIEESYKGQVYIQVRAKSVSVKLQIKFFGCTVDVDLVIALKAPEGFWPRWAVNWKTQPHGAGISPEIIEQVLKSGVHLVARHEHQITPVDEEFTISRWRLSFSIAEGILMRSLSDEQRNCYRILKVILETSAATKTAHSMVTTFHLKTLLLHANEELTEILTEREYIVSILKQLINSLEEAKLRHYFVPEINLFHNLSYLVNLDSDMDWYKKQEFLVNTFQDILVTLPRDLTDLMQEAKQGTTVIYRIN